jgi:hypothetical protein
LTRWIEWFVICEPEMRPAAPAAPVTLRTRAAEATSMLGVGLGIRTVLLSIFRWVD